MSDEFYVGYVDRAPAGLARFNRAIVIALAVCALSAVGLVGALQSPLRDGLFEFGVTRTFEGVLLEEPLPMLRTEARTGGRSDGFLLVGFGKHGLPEFAHGSHGRRVRFDGSLIRHAGVAMIEMNAPDSFEVLGDGTVPSGNGVEPLGAVAIEGELVDTKCYLGVMRPSTGKVHRACAARCLKGGIPPGILVRGEGAERDRVLMLVGEVDPEWAGRRIAARGRLELRDGVPVVITDGVELAEVP